MKFSAQKVSGISEISAEVQGCGQAKQLTLGQLLEAPGLYFLRGKVELGLGSEKLLSFQAGDLVLVPSDFAGEFLVTKSGDCTFCKAEVLRSPELGAFLTDYYHLLLSFTRLESFKVKHESVKFSAGEVVISEGTTGSEVYLLLDGKAEVLVDKTKVGEVLQDEIFGAVSAVTGAKRNATVIAQTDCELLKFSKDDFEDLIRHRPSIAAKLIKDLARALTSANVEVVAQQRIMRSLAG